MKQEYLLDFPSYYSYKKLIEKLSNKYSNKIQKLKKSLRKATIKFFFKKL